MKPGLLCLLLLPACSFFSTPDDPDDYEYVLTWYCASSDGCEREDEVAQIDHATRSRYTFLFTSTQDVSFSEEADRIYSQSLPYGCSWLHNISLFGHDLERSRLCITAGGFDLGLTIPNEDPTTFSQWVVSGRDTRFL